jgi:uncharacterized protein DUF6941
LAVRVTFMLADSAQEVGGKLYILGGGWSVTGPVVPPSAVVIKIDVPWDEANRRHTWVLRLIDEDGMPVPVDGDGGELRVEGTFEVGRPPGIRPGTPIDVPLAVNFGPLPLRPGTRYVWELSIDGRLDEDWNRQFLVREA